MDADFDLLTSLCMAHRSAGTSTPDTAGTRAAPTAKPERRTLADAQKRFLHRNDLKKSALIRALRHTHVVRVPRITQKTIHRAAPARHTRQQGASTSSTEKSGDGNPDPDPERASLLTQAALADLLCISTKTLQNLYSSKPHTLPPAISIPGARGPRWTPQAVQAWLTDRPAHTTTSAPVAPKRRPGRPRIAALRSAGAA